MKKWVAFFVLLSVSVMLSACQETPIEKTYTSLDFVEEFPNVDNYYQIFIRSFADSDGDGIGDLKGIEENLDYVYDLGVTAIWLSPFHPSNAYHGYGVTNYYEVDPDYGTLEDLRSLIASADTLGIDIMMDLVINHSSDQHPWYQEALSNPSSPYREYYYFNGGSGAYQSFVGGLVDFDPRSESFREEVKDMLDFYVDIGIRKFRLDAAKHFYDKPGLSGIDVNAGVYILGFNAYLKNTYGKDTFIVSEVFDYSEVRYPSYVIGSDSLFDFFGMLHVLNKVGLQSSRSNYVSILDRYYQTMANARDGYISSNFLSNHDIDRLSSRITNPNARRQAVTAMMLLPGNPFLYYGEELDLVGIRKEGIEVLNYGTAYDEFRRTAFLWGDERQTSWFPDTQNEDVKPISEHMLDETSMYHLYKTMFQLRLQYPALMYGGFEPFEKNDYNIQGFYRTFINDQLTQSMLVIHNIDNQAQTIEDIEGATVIYGSYDMPAYGTLILLLSEDR